MNKSIVVKNNDPIIKERVYEFIRKPEIQEKINAGDWNYLEHKVFEISSRYPYANAAFFWSMLYDSGINFIEEYKRIPDGAFAYTTITDLDIPEGTESIGFAAFKKSDISYVSIPKSVKIIESFSFSSLYGGILDIEYAGTKSEWRKIKKDSNWLNSKYGDRIEAHIRCIDNELIVIGD